MKKLLLLVVMCFVGMMVPQVVLADVTIDTSTAGKVVVTSTKAGDFATYLNNATQDQLNALKVDEIVFNGKFNQADLEALSAKGCCTQKIVNMRDAEFIKAASSSSSYKLYKTINDRDNSQASDGNLCIVEGTLWKKDRPNPPVVSWIPATEEDYNNAPQNNKQDATGWFDDSTKESHNSEVGDGWYYKVPESGSSSPFIYYRVEKTTTFGWSEIEYNNGVEKNNPTMFSDEDEMNADTEAPNYSEAIVGGTIFEYKSGSWQLVTSSGNEETDYTQMHFDYWGSNVEEIITSNHVGENDALPLQLCNNCSNLKTLTLGSGSFNGLGNNVTSLQTVNVKKDVTGLGKDMFSQKSSLTTLTFEEDGNKPLTIGQGCFEQCTGLTGTISLPKRISEIGADAFKETTGIEEVEFNEPSNLTTIHSGTFAESGIKRVTIPKSVTLIENGAFQGNTSTTRLEEVTFQGGNTTPLVIKTQAFQNCVKIKNVNVNVKPSERLLVCEYNAFDFEGMEGQTVAESDMTTLHFLEDDFDFYAGAWKKGMAFDQEGLNGIKDGMDVTVGGQQYVKAPTQNVGTFLAQIDNNNDGYYHTENYPTTKYAPGNGWQQFAKTSSPREVVFKGYVYMTYSTDKACSLPKGLIAFRVTDYVQPGTDPVSGKTINGRLVLKMIDQVPTETGMLLISTKKYVVTDETSISKIYFGDPTGTPTQYPHEETNSDKLNYMVPAVSGVKVAPVSKGPYSGNNSFALNGTSDFDHRNFIMLKDTHQFIRTQKGTMANNRAFLSLPIDKFTNDNEKAAEGPNPWNAKAGDAFNTYDTTTPDPDPDTQEAKTMMFFEYDVEEYGMIWPLIPEKELTGIATGITNVNKETVHEGIYTLQGVKVSVPNTKGIYIVNGKKVVLK